MDVEGSQQLNTLRRWEKSGRITVERTLKGHHRIFCKVIRGKKSEKQKTA
jgi:hypothetical protein